MPVASDYLEHVPAPRGRGSAVKTYLSLDPCAGPRGDRKSYAAPLEIGVIPGVWWRRSSPRRTRPTVVPRDHHSGWQGYASPTRRTPAHRRPQAPISTAVGVTGMPGHTAYFGLFRVGKPGPERRWSSRSVGAVGRSWASWLSPWLPSNWRCWRAEKCAGAWKRQASTPADYRDSAFQRSWRRPPA